MFRDAYSQSLSRQRILTLFMTENRDAVFSAKTLSQTRDFVDIVNYTSIRTHSNRPVPKEAPKISKCMTPIQLYNPVERWRSQPIAGARFEFGRSCRRVPQLPITLGVNLSTRINRNGNILTACNLSALNLPTSLSAESM